MANIIIATLDKLPERCCDCPCCKSENGMCQAIEDYRTSEWRPFWCPLKEQEGCKDCKHRKERHYEESGEWKINSDGYYPYCSVCGTAADQSTKRLTKYCPECGARMDGGADDENS